MEEAGDEYEEENRVDSSSKAPESNPIHIELDGRFSGNQFSKSCELTTDAISHFRINNQFFQTASALLIIGRKPVTTDQIKAVSTNIH